MAGFQAGQHNSLSTIFMEKNEVFIDEKDTLDR